MQVVGITSEEQDKDVVYIVTHKTLINIAEATKPSSILLEEQKEEEKEKEKPTKPPQLRIIAQDEELQTLIDIINQTKKGYLLPKESVFMPINGVIVSGQSGSGKTLLIKTLSSYFEDVKFFFISSYTFLSKFVGEAEQKLDQIFANAKTHQASVIFLDDMDLLMQSKDQSNTIILALMSQMQQIQAKDALLVILATQSIENVSHYIRKAGFFDKEIKLGIPNSKKRMFILKYYLGQIDNKLTKEDVEAINDNMNGFTGADVFTSLRKAILSGLTVDKESEFVLQKHDIEEALLEFQPIGLKDLILDIPKLEWSDIGGYDAVKLEVQKVIEWPLKHPEAFERMGISPSKGILLFGPPGCCKTMIAKAIATESQLNFVAIKGPELFSKFVGDTEKAIRDLFKRARLCAPCVIFFDEIDAIGTQRSIKQTLFICLIFPSTDVSERVLCQLLTEMDGMEHLKQVIVIAATNRPDIIDQALLRPGRFDHLVYVPPPNLKEREEIFKINIVKGKMPVEKFVKIDKLAHDTQVRLVYCFFIYTQGYTGAEICLICREAGLNALGRSLQAETILEEDFKTALIKVQPRLTQQLLDQYVKFQQRGKLK